jgi:pimeloyl-ACP methyl ester carboxylesterase
VSEYTVDRDGVRLSVSDDGDDAADGPAVVLLHGLTATRRYVVMGSRSLQRSGHRVLAYDARGHGRSSPANDPAAYEYEDLGLDLEAVMDGAGIDRAVLAGASMGAHTLLWLALNHPERVAGVVVITPAYLDRRHATDPGRLEHWDALSEGLRTGGIDGFLAAQGEPVVPARWRDTVVTVIRQRLAGHEHLDAVADALHVVPRSHPFDSPADLAAVSVPAVIVVSDDEPDPEHPKAVGQAYAETIPGARLVTDEPGRSPTAWQGSQLSRLIAEVVERAA